MDQTERQLINAVEAYGKSADILIDLLHPLGFGEDGKVWPTNRMSAVKAFYRTKNFHNELRCYTRLIDLEIHEISGFAVPTLLGFSSKYRVIELSIVSPPHILDFGKAYIDKPPDYDPLALKDSLEAFREAYESEAEWEQILQAVAILKSFGIFYYDLKPGNIKIDRSVWLSQSELSRHHDHKVRACPAADS